MNKMKLYKKILLFEIGILATLILHYFITDTRGYKAIGGEFLLLPLLYILYKGFKLFELRVIETREYFKEKEIIDSWKEEGLRDYAK